MAIRGALIESLDVTAYTIPTTTPESDSTLSWNTTTIVVVEAMAAGISGFGYTYADRATARLIRDLLAGIVNQTDAMDVNANWMAMELGVRNLGRSGIVSMAVSAVDIALWDLKARLIDVPLVKLLGSARENVHVYGSGGFCSYTIPQLQEQLTGWTSQGITAVKMKVGRNPEKDAGRVHAVRDAIGPDVHLYVDAGGAYSRKQALAMAEKFAEADVCWLEEPVVFDDFDGLRLLRDRAPAGMNIVAGEYGYEMPYFRRLMETGAVDVVQADATRCGGITGFLRVNALCDAFALPLSARGAPGLHMHLGCSAHTVRNIEYCHDHARIESMFFEGVLEPMAGKLTPDFSLSGLGLTLKRMQAERYAA